eukprot:250077_1
MNTDNCKSAKGLNPNAAAYIASRHQPQSTSSSIHGGPSELSAYSAAFRPLSNLHKIETTSNTNNNNNNNNNTMHHQLNNYHHQMHSINTTLQFHHNNMTFHHHQPNTDITHPRTTIKDILDNTFNHSTDTMEFDN